MSWLEDVIGCARPVIAMAHLPPLPGAPLYDAGGGMKRHRRLRRTRP